MRFACLGSGSKGNAWVVEASGTCLLVDCGLTVRDTVERLAQLHLGVGAIDAVVVTHEHSDHVRSAAAFADRAGCPVWMTHGCLSSLETQDAAPGQVELLHGETPVEIGHFEVLPYTIPHDAREPVHFVFSDGGCRVGMLTDAGHITTNIEMHLTGCQALVLECNHDPEMLRASRRYPESLKQRILGPHGHLENAASANLLRRLAHGGLQHVVAAHLSQENNTPALAAQALGDALGCAADWIGVASQEYGLDWRVVN